MGVNRGVNHLEKLRTHFLEITEISEKSPKEITTETRNHVHIFTE